MRKLSSYVAGVKDQSVAMKGFEADSRQSLERNKFDVSALHIDSSH